METRFEYMEPEELEFIALALAVEDTPTVLDLAIGFEAFAEHISNDVFGKGLSLKAFGTLIKRFVP